MGFEIDTSGFEKYQLDLLKASNHFRDFEERFLNTLANMIIQKVIPRTPVRTGTLRRNYKVSRVSTVGDITTIEVYNDARSNGAGESYASYVEFGHFTRNRIKWVEGTNMLTISTDEVEAEMQRVWDILFVKWCKEMGI